MKKVAIFYKTFSTYGGQERVVYRFSHFLARKGYKVKVFSYKIKSKPTLPNVEVERLFIPNFGRGLRSLAFALRSYSISKELKQEGYLILGFGKTFYQDIFRAGGGVHKFYVDRAKYKYPSSLSRFLYLLRKKALPSYWITSFIEKLTFESKNLKAVIVPTLFVKEQILKFYSPSAKLVLIRNGVDLLRFSPERAELGQELRRELKLDGHFVFSYVSTNFHLKGFSYLLEACKVLKERGLKFKLIAAGNSKGWMREVKKRGLSEDVILLGKVKDVEKVYLSSDFFVYPTLFDASANVVLEAMACGVPVITSRFSGTGELIQEGINGFLVNAPENPLEIAEKMEMAMESSPKEMGLSAREVAEKYPEERVFSEYEELISKFF